MADDDPSASGYFLIPFSFEDDMFTMCDGSLALFWLCGWVLSLASQWAGDPWSIDGWTSRLTAGQLAKECRSWSEDAMVSVLHEATSGVCPLLEVRDLPVDQGGGFLLRALVENWPKAAKLVIESHERLRTKIRDRGPGTPSVLTQFQPCGGAR